MNDRINREQMQQSRMNDAWGMLSGILNAGQMIPERQIAPAESLPLTVLAGFLGAGKTTLLNHLLIQPHGKRLVVLVNDFGRINIDALLVIGQSRDTISLSNGCACCSLAGDLTRKLIELAQRSDPPDAIVLEASGLADPHGIAQIALANPALRLDGIVTMVDAESMQEQSTDALSRDVFAAQLTAADLLILNKLDLLGGSALEEARAWLVRMAPGRPILATTNAHVPTEIVLGLGRSPGKIEGHALQETQAYGFGSWSVSCEGPLDPQKIRTLLGDLPATIVRAKGILWLSDQPTHRTIYQRVGQRWGLTPSAPWLDMTPGSSLVFIGPAGALSGIELEERLRACSHNGPFTR